MRKQTASSSPRSLAGYFRRNGYVRIPDPSRLREGAESYKKGFEVRLVANSRSELKRIRALLARAGFTPGRPWVKGNQLRQPIYGRDAVMRFLALVRDARG